MRNSNSAHISAAVLIMVAMAVINSCGSSSPNTTGAVSSASSKIVACPAVPAATVSITTSPAFAPASTPIAINDIVKWTNNDTIDHTVTSGTPGAPDNRFDSGHIAPNATVCVQFLAAGSYAYFCNIHTFMTGIVTAQ
jgi:plastocyanin